MSNKTVCVLAPNGRRQTVKVTPHTTILQILEEVCKKQQLNPEEYDIKHFNKVLDTTSTVFFAGLPNNAQLELLPITKHRAETDVTIALNLESGNRLTGTFKPQDTLWDVLTKLCSDQADLNRHPVIIYTRNEVYGERLKVTSLRSLGITGGRAMLRLINKSPEELQVQNIIATPLPSKPAEEKPYVRKLQKIETPEPIPQVEKSEEAREETKKKASSPPPTKKGVDVVNLIRQEKKQKLDGFATKGYSLKEDVKPEPMDTTPSADSKDLSVGDDNIEQEFVFLDDRNTMVFSMESAESVPSSELPDEFFELTIDDAKKLLRDIKQRQHELENAGLQTAAMRNLEESKKQIRQLNRYKRSIIRVQFPDRTVLQGTFNPTDTIATVMEFVRNYLENKNGEFYLFTSPPKSILNGDSRLIEIGCVPGAILHYGSDLKDDQYLRNDLKDKFTTTSVASLAASKMRKQAQRGNSSIDGQDFDLSTCDVNVGASTSKDPAQYEDYEKKPRATTSDKVPKWFKPCK